MFIGVFGPLFKNWLLLFYFFFGCEYLSSLSVQCMNPVWWLVLKYLPHSACSLFSVAYLLSWGKDPLMATFAFAALTLELLTKTSLSDSFSQRSPLFSSSSSQFYVFQLILWSTLIGFSYLRRGFLFLSFILPFPLPSFPLLFLVFRIPVLPASRTEETFLSLTCALSAFVESRLPEETRVYFWALYSVFFGSGVCFYAKWHAVLVNRDS